jgi:type I restriction enzyme S subunit
VWQKTILQNLCEITSSKRIYAADYQSEGVPFFRGKEIIEKHNGNLGVSTQLFISEDKFLEIKRRFGVPQPGDLLLTSVGTLGVPYVVKPSEVFYFKDGNLTWFRYFNNLDSQYLYYWLLSPQGRAQLKKCTIGSSQPAFTIVLLKDMEIQLPPFAVQRRITGSLSGYDDLIENNLRRIKILEEMAQSLYREWFVKFRFPGHQKVKMVNSPLGKIPEGWEVTPLNNLCIRITDGSHSSPKSVEMGYPMASVKDMRDWALDEDSCRRIAESDYHILVRNDCKPLVNDVLIAKDGSYLKHAFVVEEQKELVILSSIAILRPNLEQILPHILCMYLRQPEVRSRLSGYVSGVALPRIILKDFAKFLAVKPEMPLQTQFMMAVEPFVRLIHVLIKKNSTLRQTRDLLLPKLISGELDVSELDIKTTDERL